MVNFDTLYSVLPMMVLTAYATDADTLGNNSSASLDLNFKFDEGSIRVSCLDDLNMTIEVRLLTDQNRDTYYSYKVVRPLGHQVEDGICALKEILDKLPNKLQVNYDIGLFALTYEKTKQYVNAQYEKICKRFLNYPDEVTLLDNGYVLVFKESEGIIHLPEDSDILGYKNHYTK